ncbi:hypothetical protein FACS18949_06630 [Clostridia bacterium]|nr:hypothetical protein FACS189425_09200 [Clostridia bacterium]GHV33239.1 hypothetical protein FACS18949_06630 [Clostridia bacterium]
MALAIKKKDVTNYLVIDYDCGSGVKTSAIFKGIYVPVVHSTMLKQRVAFFQNNPQYAPKGSATTDVDIAAEIEKFYSLKEKGVISEDEFSAKKAQLLGL